LASFGRLVMMMMMMMMTMMMMMIIWRAYGDVGEDDGLDDHGQGGGDEAGVSHGAEAQRVEQHRDVGVPDKLTNDDK
jgi:hypothetical protein